MRILGTMGQVISPLPSQLLTFAQQQLKVNYIFWTRSPSHHDDVLLMLNQNSQTSTPSGGLDPTCPSSIASCIDSSFLKNRLVESHTF